MWFSVFNKLLGSVPIPGGTQPHKPDSIEKLEVEGPQSLGFSRETAGDGRCPESGLLQGDSRCSDRCTSQSRWDLGLCVCAHPHTLPQPLWKDLGGIWTKQGHGVQLGLAAHWALLSVWCCHQGESPGEGQIGYPQWPGLPPSTS